MASSYPSRKSPPPSITNDIHSILHSSPSPPSVGLHRNPANPAGPHQVECSKTDADPSRWPKVGPVLDSKGLTCQWVVSPEKYRSKWLSTLGRSFADKLGVSKNSQKEEWKLKDFPTGYQLYTYVKGTREDQYLFGSTTVLKFRTANEFLPHLLWLASNGTIDCLCKYCSSVKNQLQVNLALGLLHSHKLNNDGNQASDHLKRRKRSQSPVSDDLSTSYEFQGPYLNEELNRDILENRSNFRKHELVWCLIEDLPIGTTHELSTQTDLELGIKFWPGLCEEIILYTESRAFISIPDDDQRPDEAPNETQNQAERPPGRPKGSLMASIASGFENQQRYKWKIRLLGLSDLVIREEAQILPWLFKSVDLKQKFGMKNEQRLKIPQHVKNRHHSTRPALRSFTSLEEILVVFQLALQIAANLEEFWVAHDRYDAYPDPDTNQKSQTMPQVDQDGSVSYLPKIWFQGIWWGAEKIWLYDVVRLNDFRRDLAVSLKGRTPSNCPGKSSRLNNSPREICYFLKIEGIYRDELGKKLIIMGKIFDLVRSEKKSNNPLSSSLSMPTNEKRKVKKSKKWMPEPPPGYRFRQITKAKEMNHLHVECISGRFYSPTRKNHSDKFVEIGRRLAPKVAQDDSKLDFSLPQSNISNRSFYQEQLRWSTNLTLARQNASLFGLTPGQENFMRCRKWQPTRAESILKAELSAEEDMIAAYQKLKFVNQNDSVINTNDPSKKSDMNSNNNKNKNRHGHRIHRDKNDIMVIEIDP